MLLTSAGNQNDKQLMHVHIRGKESGHHCYVSYRGKVSLFRHLYKANYITILKESL